MNETIIYSLNSKAQARQISRRLRNFCILSEIVPLKYGAHLIVHVTKHGHDSTHAAFLAARDAKAA